MLNWFILLSRILCAEIWRNIFSSALLLYQSNTNIKLSSACKIVMMMLDQCLDRLHVLKQKKELMVITQRSVLFKDRTNV